MAFAKKRRMMWARYGGDVLVFVYGGHIVERMTQGGTMEVRTTYILKSGNSIGQDSNGQRGKSNE